MVVLVASVVGMMAHATTGSASAEPVGRTRFPLSQRFL